MNRTPGLKVTIPYIAEDKIIEEAINEVRDLKRNNNSEYSEQRQRATK